MVITIDGLSGTGKSTVAKAVAEELGFFYVSTGRIYRSLAYSMMIAGEEVADKSRMLNYIDALALTFRNNSLVGNGIADDNILQNEAIAGFAAEIGSDSNLKSAVSKKIILAVDSRNAVVEGRKAGVILFPDAILKVYLYADDEERVARKLRQMPRYTYDWVRSKLDQRDVLVGSILGRDAYRINTSVKSTQAVVKEILEQFRKAPFRSNQSG